MKLISGHDATISDWIERHYGWVVQQSPRSIFGAIDAAGVLRGALVLTWRADTTAELHLFGRTSNDVWKVFFAICFHDLGVHRLEARTTKKNRAIKRAAPKFGFRFEGVSRSYYGPKQDALVFSMTADQCRWIRTHGQPLQIAV